MILLETLVLAKICIFQQKLNQNESVLSKIIEM